MTEDERTDMAEAKEPVDKDQDRQIADTISRRQSSTLPRDFRSNVNSDQATEAPKSSTVPRCFSSSHSRLLAPNRRKGGLPRLLKFLRRKRAGKGRSYFQDSASTEGVSRRLIGRWCQRPASQDPATPLRDLWCSADQDLPGTSLANLSMTPLLGNPRVSESASSCSASQMEILNTVLRESVYISETSPPWCKEENIWVIAHVDHLSRERDRLNFRLGQRIRQLLGANDDGLAYGVIKRHRFSKQRAGYYPASYVIPQPPKLPMFVRFFRRKPPIPEEILAQIRLVQNASSTARRNRVTSPSVPTAEIITYSAEDRGSCYSTMPNVSN